MHKYMTLQYFIGDATLPIGDNPKIIAHIVNDNGGWGRGFSGALSKRYPKAEERYRIWYRNGTTWDGIPFQLGKTQIVRVGSDIWVANMLAQHDYLRQGRPAIRYLALAEALTNLQIFIPDRFVSVHMPRIGTGLAGGTWTRIEPMIQSILVDRGIDVYVYNLSEQPLEKSL